MRVSANTHWLRSFPILGSRLQCLVLIQIIPRGSEGTIGLGSHITCPGKNTFNLNITIVKRSLKLSITSTQKNIHIHSSTSLPPKFKYTYFLNKATLVKKYSPNIKIFWVSLIINAYTVNRQILISLTLCNRHSNKWGKSESYMHFSRTKVLKLVLVAGILQFINSGGPLPPKNTNYFQSGSTDTELKSL